MARQIRMRDSSHDSTFELNLAPMMDMMVALIPFLLLSVTFMAVMIIDLPLPAAVAKALEEDRNNKDPQVSIELRINPKTGYSLEVTRPGAKGVKQEIPMTAKGLDFEKLHAKLVEVKLQNPKIFKVSLRPDSTVEYDSIVKTMDATREIRKTDPKVMIDGAESPLLFPDVILADLMEQ